MPSSVSPYARMLGLRGDLRITFVESPALADNALGDPSNRPVVAYLPPGYDDGGSKRYPAIYILHGYTGNAAGGIGGRAWETSVVQWADRLIADGAMRPAIVILVDGFTRLGGSQFVDSIHNGDYATYVARDVIAHVDANYRTIAAEGGRAVAGKSSGGFGAMHLSMRFPGTFAAFASHSGDAYFRLAYPASFAPASRTLEAYGYDVAAFVSAFEGKHKRGSAEFSTIEMLGYTAAYSPRSAVAFDLDLPWDRKTGAIDEGIFQRWFAFDPVEEAPARAAELGRLRLRYLDCGRKDEYGLDVGAREMARAIEGLGLSVRHEEFDDDHRNVGYRYAISLPALSNVLETA